jgi:hypothetical protein
MSSEVAEVAQQFPGPDPDAAPGTVVAYPRFIGAVMRLQGRSTPSGVLRGSSSGGGSGGGGGEAFGDLVARADAAVLARRSEEGARVSAQCEPEGACLGVPGSCLWRLGVALAGLGASVGLPPCPRVGRRRHRFSACADSVVHAFCAGNVSCCR